MNKKKKQPKYDPSVPIDAKQPKRKRKSKLSKYHGGEETQVSLLGEAAPRGGSRSIATRTQTSYKGMTSGGLPSLGKKRK